MTVYAKWEKQKVNYTVRHLLEKLPDAEKENPGGDKEEYPDLDKPVEEEIHISYMKRKSLRHIRKIK